MSRFIAPNLAAAQSSLQEAVAATENALRLIGIAAQAAHGNDNALPEVQDLADTLRPLLAQLDAFEGRVFQFADYAAEFHCDGCLEP